MTPSQTNGEAGVSNREINRISKKTISSSRRDWSLKLDETVWANRTTSKSHICVTLFQMGYRNMPSPSRVGT